MFLIKVSILWKEARGVVSTDFLRQSGLDVKSSLATFKLTYTGEGLVLLSEFLDRLGDGITALTSPKCVLRT